MLQEVEGPGVIGQQPWLGPGEQFTYSSGAVLKTPVGDYAG
jgi:ApaG protein